MKEKQLLFQFEDRQVIQELLENVNEVMKDTDATEEKEKIKDFLQKVSQSIDFVVIGEDGSGKTSFLDALFEGCFLHGMKPEPTVGIKTIRYGEEEMMFQIDRNWQRTFLKEESLKGLSINDIQGLNEIRDLECQTRVKELVNRSDVLLAIFSAEKINSSVVWDFLETNNSRKIIFVLTKCDLLEQEQVEKNVVRFKQYMQEAEIEAPIFCTSSKSEQEGNYEKSGFSQVREHIKKHIIGENPVLTKQYQNVKELKCMMTNLASSFALRKKEHEADVLILNQINEVMDTFCIKNEKVIEGVKNVLAIEINKTIDEYQKEIINKLDPHRIKENFGNGGADFAPYLNLINEAYQKRMTNNVGRITREAVCKYFSDLENIFDEATGYFRKRDSLLKLEDKFYGTIALSKKTEMEHITRTLTETRSYYTTLSDASEELFMELWKIRKEYDRKVTRDTIIGGIVGGVTGGIGVPHLITLAVEGSKYATLLSAIATPLGLIMGAFLSAVVISQMVNILSSGYNEGKLEEKTRECIELFTKEIEKTRIEMLTQILEMIDVIFKRELEMIDKTFVNYRMAVNIDDKNIPLLEQKMEIITKLMEEVEKLEKRFLLC